MTVPRWILERLQLDVSGSRRILGHLEYSIMTLLWEGGWWQAREVSERLTPGRNINTVMSTLTRLVKKGLVLRRPGVPAAFQARQSEAELNRHIRLVLAQRFVADVRTLGAPHFWEELSQYDPKTADDWSQLIDALRDAPRPKSSS